MADSGTQITNDRRETLPDGGEAISREHVGAAHSGAR
jgi:hypothetical protein